MKITPLVGIGVLIALVFLVFVFKVWVKGGVLPPHEFAYGAALGSCEAIPQRMDQFLSLEEMDPSQIQIQTFVGNNSEKNLKPLIAYISSQKKKDLGALVKALEKADELSSQKEKAVQFVNALLPYRDALRDESDQGSIIVFVHYGLKQPSSLSQAARTKISNLVKQLDAAKQSAQFDSRECPADYLVGNINIYPLALENTSWHKTAEFGTAEDAPVLEIRFMGLKGVFRYLLDEIAAKTGDRFVHLDGESI